MFHSSCSFSHCQSMDANGNSSSSIDEEIYINPVTFLDFPSPFLDNDDNQHHFQLSDLSPSLSRHQQQKIQESNYDEILMDGHDLTANVITRISTETTKSGGKRRNDRHRKIDTARGPRDRRMRLSLPIARKFFDLQDMLGFDKPSKTIDWLFSKSMAAIKDLNMSAAAGGGRIVSLTSESEVMSIAKMSCGGEVEVANGKSSRNLVDGKEKKSKEVVKQGVVKLLQTRESRDKARARARERTMEKKKLKLRLWCYSSQEMNVAQSHDELLGHPMVSVNTVENLSASTCATTAQLQKPSEIFVTNPNGQQQKPNLNSPVLNPISVLYPSFSEQKPAGYYADLTSSEIVWHFDHQFLS